MPPTTGRPELPLRFIVVTFVAAALVGAAVLYLGLIGVLGATIP